MNYAIFPKNERTVIKRCVEIIFDSEVCLGGDDIRRVVKEMNFTKTDDSIIEEYVLERLREMSNLISYNRIIGSVSEIEEIRFPDSSEYNIHFKDLGENIKIDTKDLIERKAFDIQFVSKFHLVPVGDSESWKIFLGRLFDSKRIRRSVEKQEVGEMDEIGELILRTITSSGVASRIEDTVFSTDRIYEENGEVFVGTHLIKKVLDKNNVKFEMRKLRVVLDRYLKTSSRILRVGDKTFRYWIFDLEKVGPLHRVKVDMEDG